MKKQDGWKRFIDEATCNFGEEKSNVKFSFVVLTKKYGRAYIQYLQATWEAADSMGEAEFIAINGDIPYSFFKKVVKGKVIQQ